MKEKVRWKRKPDRLELSATAPVLMLIRGPEKEDVQDPSIEWWKK